MTWHSLENPRQRLRLRRNLLALLAAAAQTLLCWSALKMGYWRGGDDSFRIFLAVIWTGNFLLMMSFIMGLNRRFRDPSLTFFQIFWATLVVMSSVFMLERLQMVLLMFFLLIMFFAAFRLTLKGFIAVAVLSSLGYGVVILLSLLFHPGNPDPPLLTLVQWVGFTVVLSILALVGADLSALRRTVSQKNRELEEALTRIGELAVTDELTGVFNRRHILEVLGYQKDLADRGGRIFSLCFLDLDHFKRINDQHGHFVGDVVLKRFAQTVTLGIRRVDYLSRFGGEEFLVLLVDTGLEGALNVAERLRADIEAMDLCDLAPGLKLTASMGVCCYVLGQSLEETLAQVDQALYTAKRLGRNCVHCSLPRERAAGEPSPH